jgi:hypothetical protein
MPGCEEAARGRGPDVDGFAAKFCSPKCEVKYDHIKSDAEDARAAAEAAAEEESWP